MSPYSYLRKFAEKIPKWLSEFQDSDGFSREHFFASRVVYYPGAGTDGHPVKLFGSTHCAHCFVYADYGVSQDRLETELAHSTRHFNGYHTKSRIKLTEKDLAPSGWIPHVQPGPVRLRDPGIMPFGFLEILERDDGMDDDHGPERLAILFLGADGIAAYNALFCQSDSTAKPFAIVIQDHGFGGNYDSFGGGSLLERGAIHGHVLPRFLLVAERSKPWKGFSRIQGIDGDPGGMHSSRRFLHEQDEA